MTALHVRGLSKSFGSTAALSDLDLLVESGSITSVLGPSGCGKTTFLRLVAGFIRPDAGTVTVGDTEVAGPSTWVPPQQRRIGYLPQEGALFPHLDVAANITFGLPRARRTGDRVAELLDLVELPADFARRSPHELSGGQQQRVALARALAPAPGLVLLDEPFSALDAALRVSTGRAVAKALRATGATGILVTHDQSEALSLSDQVVTLREGRLVQAGDPVSAYRHPADAGQARFVGGATIVPGTWTHGLAHTLLGEVPVTSPGAWSEGARLDVALRPEQVLLSTDTAGVAGTVTDVTFLGHHAEVHVLVDGLDVVASSTEETLPRRGDQVRLRARGPVSAFA